MPSKSKGDKISPKKKTSKKSPIAKLKEEIKSLNDGTVLQKDKYLRLKAEFDNYRKRKENDTIHLLKYDGERVIKSFLFSKEPIWKIYDFGNCILFSKSILLINLFS